MEGEFLTYFDKFLELDAPGGRIERSASGFGDLLVLGRYTAFALDRPGSTIRLAPFVGLKVPTGKDDVSDSLGLQYVTERFVIEGIYQVPAVQRLNGNAVETDYSLSFGIRWKFSFLP